MRTRARRPERLAAIAAAVAEEYSMTPAVLFTPSRRAAVAEARHLCMLLGRNLTRESLASLGNYFGGRDHSTAIYGIRQAGRRLAERGSRSRVVYARVTEQVRLPGDGWRDQVARAMGEEEGREPTPEEEMAAEDRLHAAGRCGGENACSLCSGARAPR